MPYLFHLSACCSLIILQTTVLPVLMPGGQLYDLLIVLVIYLGLRRPLIESLPVTAGVGLVMDSLSGTPFGLYLSSYLWLLMGITWLIQYLHAGNVFLLVFVIIVGVLFENLVFFATVFLAEPRGELVRAAAGTLLSQAMWAAATGPMLLALLVSAQERWDGFLAGLSAGNGR